MKTIFLGPAQRTFRANATLAVVLCATAGALNASGFIAAGVYTSHVTGNVSRMSDELATGHASVAVRLAALVFAFLVGAMASTYLVEHDLQRTKHVRYVKPLALELAVVLGFAIVGYAFSGPKHELAGVLAALLSFAMGLQNALVTRISGAVVRTTHVTGVVTDLGIELVRLGLLVRDRARLPKDHPNRIEDLASSLRLLRGEAQKAALHVCILGSFTSGAVLGALAFTRWRFGAALPCAVGLAVLLAIEIAVNRAALAEIGSCASDRLTAASSRVPAPPGVREPAPGKVGGPT